MYHQSAGVAAPSLAARAATRLLVVVGLALAVVLAAARVEALVPSIPVPILGIDGGGVITTVGGATVDAAGAEPMTLIATGTGAYQGTCWVLGHLVGGSCDASQAVDGIYNLFTTGSWAGALPEYTGPSSFIGHDAWSATSTTSQVRPFICFNTCSTPASPNDYLMVRYRNTTTNSILFVESSNEIYWCNPYGNTGHTVVVPNANSPASLYNAFHADYPDCGLPTGLPDSGYVLEQIGWCASANELHGTMSNCDAAWSTGDGVAAPYTATYTETCTNTDGSTFTETASSTWTPAAGQSSPSVHLPNCWDIQPGAVQTQIGVAAGPSSDPSQLTITQPTVDTSKYPACATTACALTPYYLPNSIKCFEGPTDTTPAQDCVDQWPSESKNPSQWQCFYGSYRIALSTCVAAYPATYFSEGTSTLGQPQPGTEDPSAFPSTGTTTASGTAPGEGTAPDSTDCWGSGWSWNPVDWVVHPVECALKWAFVPTDAPSFGDIPSPLPAGWIPTFPSLGDGSCGPVTMPSISLGRMGGNSGAVTLFDTCNAPWPFARNLTYYGILAVGLIGLGYRGFEMVMKALGMDVSVSGGGDDE